MPNSPTPGRVAPPPAASGRCWPSLRPDFPEISISKIRFLESEGLVAPQRAASGYRRYTDADVERLRYVLAVQREHYVPLQVIRDHLAQIDRGQTPPSLGAVRQPDSAASGPAAVGRRRHRGAPAAAPAVPAELLEASGLTEAALASWSEPRSC